MVPRNIESNKPHGDSLETHEIMSKPLPQILEEMDANIEAAAAAARRAEEAAG
jgi:hypothetical protein